MKTIKNVNHITYKTKVKQISYIGSDELYDYIDYKKVLNRRDCDMNATDHDWYNSDMFEGMLNRYYQKIISNKRWIKIKDLPDSVSIDISGFLAVISIELPKNFR